MRIDRFYRGLSRFNTTRKLKILLCMKCLRINVHSSYISKYASLLASNFNLDFLIIITIKYITDFVAATTNCFFFK